MSFFFLPLVISLGICLVPIWLLPRRKLRRAQDYFIALQPTPPEVMRNAFVAHPLRIAIFVPFFALGASGDFWPAIVSTACFALGARLIYVLRRRLLAFLDTALRADTSMTVHAFIASQHGNDGRLRMLASGLTVFALTVLITLEAFAMATLMQPIVSEDATVVILIAAGMLVLAMLYTIFSGNSGVMHSVQLQLGMIYLGLFGSAALLLYFIVSDVAPMPAHGRFAIVFIAAACAFILYYRRSKYVDTAPITGANAGNVADGLRPSLASRLLSRFEKILNPFISVFVVLIIVLTGMLLFAVGVPVMARESMAALQAGTHASGPALLAIALVSLLYPIVDVANWQKLAAVAKDTGSDAGLRAATVARVFNSLAAEVPLLWLLMCMFGAIAVIAAQTPAGSDALQIFMQQLAPEEILPARLAVTLLLIGMFAMALSAMSSMFSATLWTLRYDLLPALWPDLAADRPQPGGQAIERRRTVVAGSGLCLAAVVLVYVADAFLGIGLTSSMFLALLFASCCAQLSVAPLVLAPLGLGDRGLGAVSAPWALLVVGVAAAVGIAAVILYLATGTEPWLWAAVPACLGSGFALFAVARFCARQDAGAA